MDECKRNIMELTGWFEYESFNKSFDKIITYTPRAPFNIAQSLKHSSPIEKVDQLPFDENWEWLMCLISYLRYNYAVEFSIQHDEVEMIYDINHDTSITVSESYLQTGELISSVYKVVCAICKKILEIERINRKISGSVEVTGLLTQEFDDYTLATSQLKTNDFYTNSEYDDIASVSYSLSEDDITNIRQNYLLLQNKNSVLRKVIIEIEEEDVFAYTTDGQEVEIDDCYIEIPRILPFSKLVIVEKHTDLKISVPLFI